MIPERLYAEALRGFLSPLSALLDDDGVSEILVNGPTEVFIERKGRLSRTPACFGSPHELLSALRLIAQYVGRPLDDQHPILEARLPDGSRVEAVLPPVATEGPTVAIRRFSRERLTLERLLALGALSSDAVDTLRVLVECKQNIVVAGGTGSGKTSLLNALSALIPEDERTIVIEDAQELSLQREHVVRLEARPSDAKGKGAVSIRDLFKASLRMRPDRIVIGEIRGGEALDLVQAMTSGHGGCLTTVHATYPGDAMSRLETMALMGGVELPLSAVRAQLASAVDVVVQTARFRDGRRRVTHVTEVSASESGPGYCLRDLFAMRHGAGDPELVPTGELPGCIEVVRAHGLDLPRAVLDAARARPPVSNGGAP